jgi:hypothetical protein
MHKRDVFAQFGKGFQLVSFAICQLPIDVAIHEILESLVRLWREPQSSDGFSKFEWILHGISHTFNIIFRSLIIPSSIGQ